MHTQRGFAARVRLLATMGVLWLSVGTAWAGAGGEDLGGLQSVVNGMCTTVGLNPCPQLPTVSQAVLEIAGLGNSPAEVVRALGNAGPAISAGNAVLGPAPTLANPAATLATLTPLGFVGGASGASPAQPYDARRNNLLYAVVSAVSGSPDTLNLIYDDLVGTQNSFVKGQSVATISVPLAVLNKDNTERPVPTLLQVVASCTGGAACLTANAVGDFGGNGNLQTKTAASVGINVTAAFAASAVSAQSHLIFEVQVPLLVTRATDSAYFYTAITGQPYLFSPLFDTAFLSDAGGTKLGAAPIGLAPSAAPLCPSSVTNCAATPPAAVFPLCASLPSGSGGASPAVAAFYALATDGEALLSAPTAPTGPIKCPF